MDPTAIFYFSNKKERLLRPLGKKRGIHSVHTFIRQIVKSKNMVTWTQLEKKRTTKKPEQRYRPGWPVGLCWPYLTVNMKGTGGGDAGRR